MHRQCWEFLASRQSHSTSLRVRPQPAQLAHTACTASSRSCHEPSRTRSVSLKQCSGSKCCRRTPPLPHSICMSRTRFGLRCHVQDRWHSCEFVSPIIVFPHRVRGHSTDSSAFAGKQGCCAVPTALPCALPAPVPATAELPAGAMAGARCSRAWHTQPSTTYRCLRLTDHRTRRAS